MSIIGSSENVDTDQSDEMSDYSSELESKSSESEQEVKPPKVGTFFWQRTTV